MNSCRGSGGETVGTPTPERKSSLRRLDYTERVFSRYGFLTPGIRLLHPGRGRWGEGESDL